MALFSVNILDSNNSPDVISDGSKIVFKDHSNYEDNTEDGHDLSDFDKYKKIIFTNPDGTEYKFSTTGDGDELIPAPSISSSFPITTNYTYTTGDGVYEVVLIAVPTWQSDIQYNMTSTHCVYYNGAIYRAISNSIVIGTLPTNTDYWELTTDSNIPTKYRLCQNFVVYCDALKCYLDSLKSIYCVVTTSDFCNINICNNEYFLKSIKLWVSIEYIDELVNSYDWTEVSNLINFTKTLCCCNG